MGFRCGRVPDRGGDRVTEKRCGNSAYTNNNGGIRGMMEAQNNSGPGGVDAPFIRGLTTARSGYDR